MKHVILFFSLFWSVLAIGQTVSSDQLYFSFPLDGSALDVSSNQFAATNYNVTGTTDRFGKANGACSFNGTNAYIDIANNVSVGTSDFTLSYWALQDAANGYVLTKDAACDGSSLGFRFGAINSINNYSAGFYAAGNIMNTTYSLTPNLKLWTHYTFVRQNKTSLVYVNGVLVSSAVDPAAAIANITNSYRYLIGKWAGIGACAAATWFKGSLDDLRLYKRALSVAEIRDLYKEPQNSLSNNMLLYYPLNGDTKDYSGNGLDGILMAGNDANSTKPTVSSDRFGTASSAYLFHGLDVKDRIECANSTKLDFKSTDSLTFSCWLNLNSFFGHDGEIARTNSGNQVLFAKNQNGGEYSFMWWGGTNRRFAFHFGSDNTVLTQDTSYNSVLLKNWNHVTLSVTPTTKKIYVNGKLYFSATGAYDLSQLNNSAITFGRYTKDWWYSLDGSLDEIRLYKRELTQAEISKLASGKQNALVINRTIGSDVAISLPNPYTSTTFTTEVWLKPLVYSSGYQGITGNMNKTVPSMWIYGNALHYYANAIYGVIPDFFTTNEWVHVSWVSDGKQFYFYKNGELKYTCAGNTAAFVTTNVSLGKADNTTLQALVDEFRVWNIARTQQQIQETMYNELTTVQSGLAASYSFNGSLVDLVTGVAAARPATASYIVSSFLRFPRMQAATDFTATGLTANWNATTAANYQLQYSNTADFASATSQIAASNSLPITGVDTVYLRARAIYGEDDTSSWSAAYRASRLIAPSGLAVSLNPTNSGSVDNTKQIVKVPSDVWFKGNFTVSTWVYVRSAMYNDRIFEFGNGNGAGTAADHILMKATPTASSNTNCQFTICKGATNSTLEVVGLPTGKWVNVAITLNGTTATIYYDGVQKASSSTMNIPNNVVRSYCYLGGHNYGAGDRFANIMLDEFCIYNRTLSQTEIQTRMNQHLNGSEDGLILYYDFDNINGTVVSDRSASKKDGVLTSINNTGLPKLVNSGLTILPTLRAATNVTPAGFTANWDAFVGASAYEVQWASKSDFSDTTKMQSIAANSIAVSTTYSPVYFRVRVKGSTTWASIKYNAFPTGAVNLANNAVLQAGLTTGQYVQVPAYNWFRGDFTVDGWVYLEDYKDGNWIRWFDFGIGAGNNNVLFALSNSNSYALSSIRNGGSESDHSLSRIKTKEWTHVAYVLKNDTATIYYNGVKVAADKKAYRPINTTYTTNYIGRSNWFANANEVYTNAKFDEFRIYSKALSQDTLIARSHRKLTGVEDSLLLYYDFDQIAGNTVFNKAVKTGASANGTVYNAPAIVPTLLTPFVRPASNITPAGLTANWHPTAGVRKYQVEYADNSAFTGSKIDSTLNTNYALTTTYSPIYFRVRALAQGLTSEWSSTSYFTAPGNGIDLSNSTAITSSVTTGKYVQVPAGTWLSGNFTVDAWVYLKSYFNYERLFDFGPAVGGASNIVVAFSGNGDSKPYIHLDGINYSAPSSVPLNQWTHIALAYNASNKEATLFMNGDVQLTKTITTNSATSPSNFIGRSNFSPDNYTYAIIDEFKISNQALSRDSIIARSHRHLSGKESDLVLYYDFDQINGSTISNLATKTGVAGNGTVFNNAAFVDSKAILTPFIRKVDSSANYKITVSFDNVPGVNYEKQSAKSADFASNLQSKIDTDTAMMIPFVAGQSAYFYRVRSVTATDTSAWQAGLYLNKKVPMQNMAYQGAAVVASNTTDIKIAGGDQVTMSCWAKVSSLDNTYIMMQGGGGGTSGKWLRVNNGAFEVCYNYDVKGQYGWQSFYTPAIVETGKWYHLAYTLDANKRITLYVNGIKYIPTSKFWSYTAATPTENILYSLWANATVSTQPMTVGSANCLIDNFQIWKTALPQDSIVKYANTPVNGKEANLAVAYNFNQIDGTSVSDLATSTATPATVVNNPLLWKASNAELTPLTRIAAANDSTLTLAWSKVANASYKIKYATKADFTDSKYVSSNEQSMLFEDLTPATTYYFSAKAITASDSSDWSVAIKGSLLGLNDSIVSYYPFNSTTNDESGNGANMINTSAVSFVNDRFAGVVRAAHIAPKAIPYFADVNDLTASFTNVAWVKLDSLGKTEMGIIAKRGTSASGKSGYSLTIGTDGKLYTSMGNEGSFNTFVSTATTPTNAWTFVCQQYNAQTKELKMFVNNQLVGTFTDIAPLKDNSYRFVLGSTDDANINLTGSLDDVRQYARPLSKNELSALYHQGGWPYTGVAISNATLTEQQDKGAEVGILRPKLADGGKNTCKAIKFEFVSGVGSTDNDKFIIVSDSLLNTAFIFDTTKQRTASVRVRAVDCDGISFEGAVVINITGTATSNVYTFNAMGNTKDTLFATKKLDGWKVNEMQRSKDTVLSNVKIAKVGNDGSYAAVYSSTKPNSNGRFAKSLESLFKTVKIDTLSYEYTFGYDVRCSSFGVKFTLGTDSNTDTVFDSKAFAFNASQIAFDNGGTFDYRYLGLGSDSVRYTNLFPNTWQHVQIILSDLNKANAQIVVRKRDIAAGSSWTEVLKTNSFVIDSTATDAKNPRKWNLLEYSIQVDSGIVDNLSFTKRKVNTNKVTVNDGLLAFYNMDNNLNDISGNKNHGVKSSVALPTPTFNRFNQANAAFQFDGTQNIEVANMGSKLPSKNVSFSVWAKQDGAYNNSLFTLVGDDYANRVNVHLNWQGGLYWDYGDMRAESLSKGRLFTSATTQNTWDHYVFVSGDNGMKIYKNNILVASKPEFEAFEAVKISLLIGSQTRGDGGSNYFIGSMDDLRIYNREITADEVKALYTEGGWPVQQLKAYDMTLQTGKSGALKVDITPADAPTDGLLYTSGDTKIASVSGSGVVTGISAGNALITVSTSNGLVRSTAIVTVNQTIDPITDIQLSEHSLTLIKGDSYQLKYKTTPAKNVMASNIVWTTNNGFALPVVNGKLSALSVCTKALVYIYADSLLKTVKDSCYVTVLPSELPTLTADTTVHFSLKAVETINAIAQPKDTLKLSLDGFFVDDSVLTYSYTTNQLGNDTIQLSLVGNVLKIYPRDTTAQKQPLSITITASDVDKQTVSKTVYVKMTSKPDLAPTVSAISVDNLLPFRKTTTIDLRKYVIDDYTPFAGLVFDSLLINKRDTAWIKNGIVSLTVRPGVSPGYNDVIKLQVSDARKQRSVITINYRYLWVNNLSPVFSKIDSLKQITSDSTLVLHLNRFVSDDFTPISMLKWSFTPAQNVNVVLKDSTLFMSASSSAWDGIEDITVFAEDEGGKRASTLIPFRQVVNLMLSGTPNVDFELSVNGVKSPKVAIQRGSKLNAILIDNSKNSIAINSWKWALTGVTPSEINGSSNNIIQYNKVGLFDVTLYATNGTGTTKVLRKGAVQVVGIMANKTSVCTDSTVTLWASDSTSGNQYQWSTGATTASIKVKPTNDTVISVKITMGGIDIVDTIKIKYVKQLTNVANDTSFCPGTTALIKPRGTFSSITWNGTLLDQYTATKAEKVVVKALVDKACPEITDQITVTLSAAPKLNMPTSTVTICEGSKDTIVVGTKDGSSFQWNQTAGVVKDTIFANAAGDYIVTATLGTCKTIDTLTVAISELPKVTAFASATNVCQGGLVTLSTDNQQGLTYKWNVSLNADNKATVAAVGNNDYYVTATNSFGCTAWDSVRVLADVPMNVHIQALPNDTLCANSQLTLTATDAKSYSWSNSVTNGQPFVLTVSNTFYVTSTSGNCEQRDSITIAVRENPRVNITALPNSPLCKGDSLTLTADGGKEYKWNGSVTNGKKFAVDQSTSYVVTVSDVNNCITEKSIAVQVNSLTSLKAVASDSLICDGDTIRLYGRGAKSYSWSTGLTDSSQIKPKSTEITKYTVTGTDINGCKATAEVEVKAIAIPTINIGKSTDTVCKGASKVLSATGTATSGYWWSVTPNGKKSPNDTSVSPDATTRYYVTATSGSCSDTLSKLVIVKGESALKIKLNTATDTAICKGASITLNATTTEVSQITWNNGVTNNVAVTPADTTTYIVTAVDQQKCAIQQSVKVAVRPLPKVVAKADTTTICSGKEVTLTGAGAATYTWSDNLADGAKRLIAANTSFTVTGVVANKCSNTATISIAALKPYQEQLGVVTYDSTTSKKVIIAWNRHNGKRTERYAVLRQNVSAGWDTIGRRAFADSALVVDKTADLDVKTYSYKLVTIDSVCHNKVESDEHRTMHVYSSVTDGTNVTVEWNSYIGLKLVSYYVARVTPDGKVQNIDTVLNNESKLAFTDKHPILGARYRILYNLPETVSPVLTKSDTGPFSQSFSNMSEASLVSERLITAFEMNIYPNPATDVMNITLSGNNGATISLFAANGSLVAQTTIANDAAAFDVSRLAAGLYSLQVQTDKAAISQSVTISK